MFNSPDNDRHQAFQETVEPLSAPRAPEQPLREIRNQQARLLSLIRRAARFDQPIDPVELQKVAADFDLAAWLKHSND